jgi:preprotein translocase subunit SecA
MVRKDQNDQVYKTKDGKWNAVLKEIEARNAKGQPVLVGTISVEVSELLGSQLARKGIKHTVLNAKPEFAQREGETIAEAGAPGAVTIATNMAGRGVDIKLGGNAEHLTQMELAKLGLKPGMPDYDEHHEKVLPEIEKRIEALRGEVLEAGGLYIIGTERHESRRIDNQLRGRSGRQGDPGESRFFLSAQDDLVRLFAGDRIYKILDRLGTEDAEGNEEPIEAKMLTNQIEKAQKKVEEQHFLQRKHTLEYDDVLNQQRDVIYTYRDEVLEGRDMSAAARGEIATLIERLVEEYMAGDFVEDWDVEGLTRRVAEILPPSAVFDDIDPNRIDRQEMTLRLQDEVTAQYDAREQQLGEEIMRALERFLLLQIIDQRWREHLYDMDYLREGIHLRGFAQIEPLVAYKNEAFELFKDLMNSVWDDFARMIFHIEVTIQPPDPAQQQPAPPPPQRTPSAASSSSTGGRKVSYSGGTSAPAGAAAMAAAAGAPAVQGGNGAAAEQPEPVVAQRRTAEDQQIGRNDPCWCGSGKKFKKCHGA